MEPIYFVNLTQSEVQTLARIFDLAIRSGGLDAARIAWPIMTKIDNAVVTANAVNRDKSSEAGLPE